MLDLFFQENYKLSSAQDFYISILIPHAKRKINESLWNNSRTESNPLLTKVVLDYWEEYDVELRLHFYSKQCQEPNIHDHRWSFYSLIIAGSIREVKYKLEGDSCFLPISDESYIKGDVYSVNHSDYHTVYASNDLITLIFRGPGEKNLWKQYDMKGVFLKDYPINYYNKNEKSVPDIEVKELLLLAGKLITKKYSDEK